jgi:hypothetical protein
VGKAPAGGPGRGCARWPVGIPSPPRGGRWKPRSRAILGTVGAKRADSAIRAIRSCRESHYRGPFILFFCVRYQHHDLPFGPSDMPFQYQILLTKIPSHLGVGHVSSGVCGAHGGTDGSTVIRGCWSWRRKARNSARVWRSLDVDMHTDVESADMGQHDANTEEDCHHERSGVDWRRGDPQDEPPLENPVRGLNNFRTPGAFWIRPLRSRTTPPLPTIARHT